MSFVAILQSINEKSMAKSTCYNIVLDNPVSADTNSSEFATIYNIIKLEFVERKSDFRNRTINRQELNWKWFLPTK